MKTILLTGATDGLGKYVAQRLVTMPVRLLLHGRDQSKLTALIAELKAAEAQADMIDLVADLSDLRQVQSLAQEVSDTTEHLDVLINNAGVGFGAPDAPRQASAQGHELRLAVNYLAPVLLSTALEPLLRQAEQGRIINVASLGQVPIRFDDLMLHKHYSGIEAYRRSKVALIMATIDTAERLETTEITVNAIHPATFVATTMVLESGVPPQSSLADGGEPIIRLALDPALATTSGLFFDQLEPARAIAQVYDPTARQRLAELTQPLLAAYQPQLVH